MINYAIEAMFMFGCIYAISAFVATVAQPLHVCTDKEHAPTIRTKPVTRIVDGQECLVAKVKPGQNLSDLLRAEVSGKIIKDEKPFGFTVGVSANEATKGIIKACSNEQKKMTVIQVKKMNYRQLRKVASERKIKGYGDMNKAQLTQILIEAFEEFN